MKKLFTPIFFAFSFVLASLNVYAQPANDECAGAINITTEANSPTCTGSTAAVTTGATATTPSPSCTSFSNNDDIFYTFTATSTTQVLRYSNLVATSGTVTQLGLALYSGTCALTTELTANCTFGFGTGGSGSTSLTGLTVGTTYILRLFTGGGSNSATFDFCLQDPPPPPANDECAGAIPVTTEAAGPACTSTTAASTTGATATAGITETFCSTTSDNDDIFYTFTATATSEILRYSNLTATSGTATSIGYQIFSGTCAGLTQLSSCATSFGTGGSGSTQINGLTVGTTYTLKLFTAGLNNSATFDFCIQDAPAAPANDECAGAITMPVTAFGSPCTNTFVNTSGATQSTVTGQPNTCTGTGIDDDVFYTFTTTIGGSYNFSYTGLTATTGTAFSVGMNVYTGTCGALAEVTSACSSGFGSGGTGSRNVILAANTTYTLRLYVGSSPNTGTFNFCISTPPPPPANDNCAGAIAITTQPFSVPCSGTVSANTTGANPSLLTETTCITSNDDDDIFYSFTAAATSQILRFSNLVATSGFTTTLGYHVFTSCASGTSLPSCSTSFGSGGAGSTTITGLTVGTTYFLQLFTGTATGATATFDFCLQNPAPPPANDNCAGAIAITTQPFSAPCSGTVSANTSGATPSLLTETTCITNNDDDDIFYSFTATATSQILRFSNFTATVGTTTTLGYHVFTSCASGTSLPSCSIGVSATTGNTTITGLTVGTTYFLQLFTGVSTGATATFDFCLQDPAPPVANDECATAIAISTQPFSTTCTSPTAANTNGATASVITETSCVTSSDNDDIFYSFTATSTTQILKFSNMVAGTGTATALGYHIFPSCGGTQLTSCSSFFGSAGAGSTTITGLTVGTNYIIRLFTGGTANSATFDFCLQDPPPPPANDECAGAISLNGGASVNGTTVGATQSMAPEICGGSTAGAALDVFYTFTAPQNGSATISQTTTDPTFDGVIIASSGACGSLTTIGCADATAGGGSETLVLNNLVAGQTYFLRVYDFSGTGSFTISASGAALPITVEYFKGSKQTAGNLLEWKVNCTGSPSANMVIERSADAIRFEGIYNTTETALRCLQPFSFTDKAPLSGTNYYRLKSTDADGRVTNSSIIAILNKTKGFEFVTLVPNPVRTEATLSVASATASSMEIIVSDIAGRQLQTKKVSLIAGSNNVKMNFANLSTGVYYITGYTSDGEKKTVKFIKD